ncbi:beta-lactamase family protein [Hyphobacterium sp. SN044]|uniref:serine hydrolase domain-containing protein n=1 Tax=Hyphobacterium sp. SN044 TaxID=2912575 RepID=UPI001F28BE95|nr:serine hydrolase domain-containing protein [Hyphobacterium sp. SN044]MCF8878663.1 beta-lactamase family protein [Hyphobacterium sp. SN044]
MTANRRLVLVIATAPWLLAMAEPPPQFDGAMLLVPAVEVTTDEARPTLDERMDRYGVSAVSLVRIENFEIVESGVYGQLSADAPAPVTLETVFQAASISKPVTAFAVLSLWEEEAIDLDRPVNDYLSRWQAPDAANGTPVTIRQLLSHTSGLGPQSYPGLERGTSPPTLAQILEGAPEAYCDPVEPVVDPGAYNYSGGGYMLLQALVEDVTGQAFEAAMRERVFAPADMNQSTFAVRTDETGVARGHGWSGEPIEFGWAEYPQSAAAGLWSTPGDLALLLVSYGRAYRGEADQVLTQRAAREMAVAITDGMGLGFGVHGASEDLRLSHAGWTLGYRSHFVFYPETGDGLVVMTNGQAGNYLIDDLMRTYGRAYGWAGSGEAVEIEPAAWHSDRLASLEGRYRMTPAGFEIELTRSGSGFELVTPRGSRYRAVPAGTDHLLVTETGDRIDIDWSTGRLRLWGMSTAPAG